MKKIGKIVGMLFFFFVIFVSISACTNDETKIEEQGTYKAGTFEGQGEGKNGPIVVEVTFTTDKIEKIEVIEHHETEGLSDKSLQEIPESVVEYQSLGVDTVSGASLTNEAVLAAISEAIEKAGGDTEALKEVAVEKEQSDEVIELTSDVAIIGGGAAGMSAALRADELGLKTVLFEKMSYLGGAISISGGNQVVMGSKLQEEAGVKEDNVDSMVNDFMKNGDEKNVPELLNLYAENVGSTTDWLHEYVGIQYEPDLHKLAEYSYDRELAYTDGGPGFAKTAREKIAQTKIDVHLETQVNELTVDDNGAVNGFVAQATDGTTYQVKAKSVIIASGGYGNNQELLTDNLKNVLYYGPESSTGDGIILTETDEINAATRLMEYGKTYPNGVEVSKGKAKSTIAGNIAVFKQNAILINANGKRVVNERASNREILEVELAQPEQMLYLLMDQEAFDLFKPAVAEAGISENDIEKWLENNGSTTPYFFHGDTINELAEAAAIDATTLNRTIETYNGYVEVKEDKDFQRSVEFMPKKIGEGPYYLVEQKPRFAATMGGLVANEQLQVINKKGEVILGLYAAGEIVGGVLGDDSPSGANNAWALTSGKLASESLAEKIK